MDKITKRMSELSEEMSSLMSQRDNYYATIDQINVRMNQIAGAIMELDKIKQEMDSKDETWSDS